MRKIALLLALAWMLAATSLEACSLCGSMSRNNSLAYEFEQAQVIVYGHIANPKLMRAGKGTTEFHVAQIIKDDPAFPRDKMLIVSQYLPVLDAKSPPKFVMFYRS